jgi:phage tail sheath protein FI
MAYTDANNDGVPSRSPSNRIVGRGGSGVVATCLEDGTEIVLTQDQATTINSYGVNTALNMNGWRLFGSYTGAYPYSTEVKDAWAPVRRMFNWQGNNFIQIYFDKVDDPLNAVLIESIVDAENVRCAAFAPTHWAGAEINYYATDNPTANLLAGKIVFRQRIAPYPAAQEIDNILSYDVSMLTEIMNTIVA